MISDILDETHGINNISIFTFSYWETLFYTSQCLYKPMKWNMKMAVQLIKGYEGS